MIDNDGVAPAAAPDDAQPEEPAKPTFDTTLPRIFDRITIQLDRERPLRLSFKSLRIFEQETGVSGWNEERIWAYPWDVKLVLTFLWVALLDDDPTLTLEQLEDLPGVEYGNLPYIRRKLTDCWGQNAPPPDAPAKNGVAPKDQPRRTGSS